MLQRVRIAVVNLTGGGLSGGYRKYLRILSPFLREDPRVEEISFFVHPRVKELEGVSALESFTWPEGDSRRGYPQLKADLQKLAPDAVFIPTGRYLDCGSIPTVVMVRNMEPLTVPFGGNTLFEGMKNLARAYEAKKACRRATRVIAVSGWVRDFLMEKWGVNGDKIGTVRHGIEAPPGEEEAVRPAAFPASDIPRYLFTAGSIRPARGLEDLVKAMVPVREREPSLFLAIAGGADPGTGFYMKKLQALAAKLGIEDRILWTGRLSPLEMSWCFRRCEAFVMTSRAEACPNTALEAMSHGCFSISVDHAPMPEFFGKSALYYKAGNAEELAALVVKGLDASGNERETLKGLAAERALDYQWKKTAALTVDQLELAASSRRRIPASVS